MGFLGSLVGESIGKIGGGYFGGQQGADIGGQVGRFAGSYLPLRKGAYIKLRKGGVAGGDAMGYQMGGYVPPGLRQISGGAKQFTVMPYPGLGEKRLI